MLAYPFTSYFARNCIKFDTTRHQLFISVVYKKINPLFFLQLFKFGTIFFFLNRVQNSNIISFTDAENNDFV